jgi:HlyD family secretion protein
MESSPPDPEINPAAESGVIVPPPSAIVPTLPVNEVGLVQAQPVLLATAVWPKALRLLPWGMLSIAFLSWGIWGRIPIRAEGRGVLIVPTEAVQLQSRASGAVLSLNVEVGDRVRKGQVLVILDQPVLRQQRLQLQNQVAQLQAQNVNVTLLQNRRSLESLQTIDRQRSALLKQRADLKTIINLQRQKLKELKKLTNQGAIARLDSELVKIEDLSLQNQRTLSNLEPQLTQLEAQRRQIQLQDTQDQLVRKNQIDDLQRQIRVVATQMNEESQIRSDYDGQILDLTINPGQYVTAGTRLGTLEKPQSQRALQGISFFAIADAKRIQPGMKIEITPDLESRERYGGIIGKVTSVARLPATPADISRSVGNDRLAAELVNAGPVIQVGASLSADATNPDQLRWTFSEGPVFPLQAGTTTQARIEVERRSLLGYLVPSLRRLTGIYR